MSGTKYRGSALYARWESAAGGTVILWAESRTFSVDEQANTIDVTVRSDTAKAFLADYPTISCTMAGLDTSGTSLTANQPWDNLNIGDLGTVIWGPEGTATGFRKRTLPALLKGKKFDSPYDGAVTWELSFDSNGGSVAKATW